MTQFRKKPVVITAITFAELVAHGIAQCKAEDRESNIVNGLPWSFSYNGHPITHESDDCYIIPTLEGSMKMGRDDMLITGVKGEIYPCKRDIFEATYEAAPVVIGAGLPPHQQRVLAEKAELDERRAKLAAFTNGPIFGDLPEPERMHLNEQQRVMAEYSSILGARIAMFGMAAIDAPKAALVTLPVIDPGPDHWLAA